MAKITSIPIFLNKRLDAGSSSTSDPIDLRYCASKYLFSLHHRAAPSTSGTCGTTIFSYQGCSIRDGSYGYPSTAGTFATAGTIKNQVTTFSPYLVPFIRIIATQTGVAPDDSNKGANSSISAELNVQ